MRNVFLPDRFLLFVLLPYYDTRADDCRGSMKTIENSSTAGLGELGRCDVGFEVKFDGDQKRVWLVGVKSQWNP